MKRFGFIASSFVAFASVLASAEEHAPKGKYDGVQQIRQSSDASGHSSDKSVSQSSKQLEVVKIGDRSWKALSTDGDYFFDKSRLGSMIESELHSLCGEGFRVAHQYELVADFANLSLSDIKKPAELPQSSEIQNDKAMHQYCSVADPKSYKLPVQKPAQIVIMQDADRKGERLKLVTKEIKGSPDKVTYQTHKLQKPQSQFCRVFCVSK
jgi:hypothetical protein